MAKVRTTTNRKVAATLAMPISKGRLQRVNDNGTFHFTLPEASTESTTAKDQSPVRVSEVLDSIEPFATARPNDLLIPTVRGVNHEQRRAKAKVTQLEYLCEVVRELSKHKHLIQEVML
ncbi:DUF1627 domain-containing protein [Scandinavium goeteborgense]|nr:DUF1627 domain-containing protein [Scandinavium goeteborgense]